MELRAYQERALTTDQVPGDTDKELATSLMVPMLGLAGEAGQLLSEYKKHLRDGEAHRLFKDRVAEELGDLLWYLANVASKFDLNLDEIAVKNLQKVQERWSSLGEEPLQFDAGFPDAERLPRRMELALTEIAVDDARPVVRLSVDGEVLGAPIGDNAYDPDGYRFHDVFHLAYAAILGWSPNLRSFLKRKRKSVPLLDEVEDGGRARVIEEGIAAFAFDYARGHSYFEGVRKIDYDFLRTIKSMTAHLEVGRCSVGDWEAAILQGFAVWREVIRDKGGRVLIDLDDRRITYLGPATVSPAGA